MPPPLPPTPQYLTMLMTSHVLVDLIIIVIIIIIIIIIRHEISLSWWVASNYTNLEIQFPIQVNELSK